MRMAFTLDHAAHHPAELQERHLERYLRAAAGAAEKNAGAGRHQRLHRFAQDRRLRGRLEREAHAVAGDPADLRDHVIAVSVIDRVRGAERARERKAVIVHVDGDDRIAAGYFGCHQTR